MANVEGLCASAPLRLSRPYNLMMTINEITESIIGSSIEVHRKLRPGLLESIYSNVCATNLRFEECLRL